MWYRCLYTLAFLLGILVVDGSGAEIEQRGSDRDRIVNAYDVARLPYPGTVSPSAIAFAPDGRSITFLNSEAFDLSRVLWRVEVAGDEPPRVIARPPDEGVTDATVSREEELRRERQRERATGIPQVVRAKKADVILIPLQGDLFLLGDDGALERLTETDSPELDPQLTDDGAKVAFVRDGELFVLDLQTREETQITKGASDDGISHGLAEFIVQEELDRSSGFWWSPDGSKIAYQKTDERHIPLFTITHEGDDAPNVETHRYPFAGAENAKVQLGVTPSSGGETLWLELAEPDDEVYLARVTWESPESLLVQVLSRDQTRTRLHRFDANTGERSLVIEETSEPWYNLHNDLHVVEGTGKLLWSSERTGFRHLELRDRDGRLIRVLTSGEWPVDRVVALDSERREVWFEAGREGPLERHLYRVSLDGGSIHRLTSEPGTHQADVSDDGEHFVLTSSRLDQPPVTTLCDRSGRVLKTLHDAGDDPRLNEVRLDPPQLTEFKTRDGVTLYGAYHAPRGWEPGTTVPLVVMVYGGPRVQYVTNSWRTTSDLTAQMLAGRGLAVWKADNRGSSRRGLAFEAALNRTMGDIEVRDQADGVRFVAASWPEVDTSRVGVTGHSYGGYLTLRCLTEAPEVFHVGVASAPVTDWDGYDTGYTERYLGTPQNDAEGYTASSVLTRADKLQGDLLVIHGMLDENVHFRHTARLVQALVAADKPFEVLPLPDERHSMRRPAGRQYIAQRTVRFFEARLDPDRP